MTTVSAVVDTATVTTPTMPAAATGAAPNGANFEAALTQAMSAPVSPQTQVPVPVIAAPDPIVPVESDDSSTVSLPSEAIAAFLAVFLAMAGQALQSDQPTEAHAQPVSAVEGEAVTADELRALLEALQQVQSAAPEQGADEVDRLFASLVDRAAGEATEADPTEQLLKLIDRLTLSSTTSSETRDLLPVFEDAVQRIDELAAKAVDLGEALEQIATTAAGIARELSAANGSVVTRDARQLPSPSEAPSQGVGTVDGARLADAIEAAKSLIRVAELGHGLHLGELRGKSEISIQLQPGQLGKLHIQLERTSDGVTAKIGATTSAGQQAVEANLTQIEDALKAAGIAVKSIQVEGPSATVRAEASTVEAKPGQSGGARPTGEQAAPSVDRAPQATGVNNAQPSSTDATTATDTTSTDRATPIESATPTEAANTTTQVSTSNSTTVASRLEAASAPAPTVSAEAIRLAQDIADQVSLLTGQGKSEFNLQLRPESLGRLHMRLTLDDGSVTVRMQAETPEAKGMIESNLGQLKQSFSEQGIRVDRFVVEVAQGQFSQQDSQHPRRSRGLVDDERAKSGRGGEGFAEALAEAGGARPVDYRA